MTEPLRCPECAEAIPAGVARCPLCGAVLRAPADADPSLAGVGLLLDERVSTPGCLLSVAGGYALLWVGLLWISQPRRVWRHVRTAEGAEVALEALLLAAPLLIGAGLVLRDLLRRRVSGGLEARFGVSALVLLMPLFCIVFTLVTEPFTRHHGGGESSAIGSLKTLSSAQSLFREADKEGDEVLDYGTLEELAAAGTTGLIDPMLGSGNKYGYLFECTYSVSTSEFLWFATARPLLPDFDRGGTGDSYFATNQEGVIFYTTSGPFRLNDTDCTMPAEARPVGR